MKKTYFVMAIAIVFLVAVSSVASAQNCSANTYYASRDSVLNVCGDTYIKTDSWGNYMGLYQTCREAVWYSQYRVGNIWYWDSYRGWYSRWYQGYVWSYTWHTYEVFLHY